MSRGRHSLCIFSKSINTIMSSRHAFLRSLRFVAHPRETPCSRSRVFFLHFRMRLIHDQSVGIKQSDTTPHTIPHFEIAKTCTQAFPLRLIVNCENSATASTNERSFPIQRNGNTDANTPLSKSTNPNDTTADYPPPSPRKSRSPKWPGVLLPL